MGFQRLRFIVRIQFNILAPQIHSQRTLPLRYRLSDYGSVSASLNGSV
jgi:hypothetical protein